MMIELSDFGFLGVELNFWIPKDFNDFFGLS